MRHLTDPANKVYVLAMEGRFYETDVHSLETKFLVDLQQELGIGMRTHFKGGYTAQGRVVVANNSYFAADQAAVKGRGVWRSGTATLGRSLRGRPSAT